MSTIINKKMALELEFVNSETYGYITWLNLPPEPENPGDPVEEQVQVATLGLGSSEDKYIEWSLAELDYIKISGGSLQFDKDAWFKTKSSRPQYDIYGDPIEDEIFTNCKVSFNADISEMELASYLPIGPDLSLDPPTDPSNYTEEEKRYEELKKIKEEYANNHTAFLIEHENAIAFANPVTGRLIGYIDTVGEAFNWYGAFSLGSETDDSTFEIKRVNENKYNITLDADVNLKPELAFKSEGIKNWSIYVENGMHIKNNDGNGLILNNNNSIEFTGEIIYQSTPLLNYFYTQTELNNGVLDSKYYTQIELNNGILDSRYYTKTEIDGMTKPKEAIYYEYINDTWSEITLNKVDEYYDLPNSGDVNSYWYAELEDKIYKYTASFNLMTQIDISSPDSLPHVLTLNEGAIDNNNFYTWNGNNWSYVSQESDLYTIIAHKTDISNPTEGEMFKIYSTMKYYKYENGELISIEPPYPIYTSLPSQYNTINKIIKFTFT